MNNKNRVNTYKSGNNASHVSYRRALQASHDCLDFACHASNRDRKMLNSKTRPRVPVRRTESSQQ